MPNNMQRSVPLVVCGNAGPVGGDILRRRDIVTYWALNVEEAAATIALVSPKVVLVREEHAPALLDTVREWKTPVVVLVEEAGWPKRTTYLEAGAASVVQAQEGARILEAVSERTGLAFAKAPRVAYEVPVEVRIGGEVRTLQTVNLSASGVCVAGIEPPDQGKTASVTFSRMSPPLTVEALIVRTFNDGRRALAGVTFTGLSPEAAQQLAAVVQEEIDNDEAAALTVEVPLTFDAEEAALDEVQARGEAAVEALKNKLRDIHLDSRRDDMLGGSKKPIPRSASTAISAELEPTLSPSERALVMGQPAPDWAGPALNARLRLHVERKQVGSASKRAVKEALTLCRTLGRGATDAPSMVEVTSVRAGLLREVYCESPRTRHGAKADPTVESLLRRKAERRAGHNAPPMT